VYLDPYIIVFPISLLVFDCDLRRVQKRQERWILTFIKMCYLAFFCTILAIAETNGGPFILTMCNMMLMVCPTASIIYSFMLTKFAWLSYPTARVDNQLERFQDIIEQQQR
jgi:hypothetical protein